MIFMKTQSNFYLFLIALISAMGGFLFGYDWVVIGGAKPFYEQYFGIAGNPVMQGWAMSSALIGCLFGALSAGKLSDRLGRKPILILAAGLFICTAVGTVCCYCGRCFHCRRSFVDVWFFAARDFGNFRSHGR